ncbi:MAG: hypothetical protein IPK61_07260 [Saprospiraceae bacterium]|nr:hypothetical protein [Saprospiraceae bacterium]
MVGFWYNMLRHEDWRTEGISDDLGRNVLNFFFSMQGGGAMFSTLLHEKAQMTRKEK